MVAYTQCTLFHADFEYHRVKEARFVSYASVSTTFCRPFCVRDVVTSRNIAHYGKDNV